MKNFSEEMMHQYSEYQEKNEREEKEEHEMEDISPIKGSGFLGTGYYLSKGNPKGDEYTLFDDAFRAPVVEVLYIYNIKCITYV